MKIIQRLQMTISLALSVALMGSLITVACAKDKSSSKAKITTERGVFTVSVDNFGQVNEHFYRGAQPKAYQYGELARLGIKTIVDLRDDAEPFARGAAEAAGLRYLNFPLSDKSYPADNVGERFLSIANDQANWPIYVHCAGGRHRTGAMAAVYRMTNEGWNIDRAYREMKDYDFYTAWGHGDLKDYVYNYYRDFSSRQPTLAATPVIVEGKAESASTAVSATQQN